MRPFRAGLCCLGFAAGLWLSAMELVLRHPGFPGRIAVALVIASQSAFAGMAPVRSAGSRLSAALIPGATALLVIGTRALLHGSEGYSEVIGVACLLQGLLTLASALAPQRPVRGAD